MDEIQEKLDLWILATGSSHLNRYVLSISNFIFYTIFWHDFCKLFVCEQGTYAWNDIRKRKSLNFLTQFPKKNSILFVIFLAKYSPNLCSSKCYSALCRLLLYCSHLLPTYHSSPPHLSLWVPSRRYALLLLHLSPLDILLVPSSSLNFSCLSCKRLNTSSGETDGTASKSKEKEAKMVLFTRNRTRRWVEDDGALDRSENDRQTQKAPKKHKFWGPISWESEELTCALDTLPMGKRKGLLRLPAKRRGMGLLSLVHF